MRRLSSEGFETVRSDSHRPTLYNFHLRPDRPFFATCERQRRPTAVNLNVHAGLEITIGLAGTGEYSHGNLTRPILPGDVALAAMWEPHGWRALAAGTEHYCVIFLPEFLGEEDLGDIPWLSVFAALPPERPWVDDQTVRRELLSLGQRLKREADGHSPAWEAMTRLLVLQVLVILRRCWGLSSGSSSAKWSERYTDLAKVMPALRLLHLHGVQHVTVAEAAGACSLSRSHFDAVFGRVMGLPFGRFRARARVDLAAHMLITTDLPAAEIAAATGFADSSHLHRAFVRRHGCTPSEYRRSTGRHRLEESW